MSVIGGVAGSSKQGRKAAWKFVKDNWEELHNRYQGGFLISRLIKVRQMQYMNRDKKQIDKFLKNCIVVIICVLYVCVRMYTCSCGKNEETILK